MVGELRRKRVVTERGESCFIGFTPIIRFAHHKGTESLPFGDKSYIEASQYMTNTTVLIETYGNINSEHARNSSLKEIIRDAFKELAPFTNIDAFDKIVTGERPETTQAIKDVVTDENLDVTVTPVVPDVNQYLDVTKHLNTRANDKLTAHAEAYRIRLKNLFSDAPHQDYDDLVFNYGFKHESVDFFLFIGDAGNDGDTALEAANRHGIPTLVLNQDDHLDKDNAYAEKHTCKTPKGTYEAPESNWV